MPTVTRRKYTRRPARKYKKKSNTKVSAATRKYVRKVMPKVEMKQYWNHTNETALSTLSQGYTTVGPLIGQGTAAANRLGNIIHLHGLHIKGALNNNSGSESFVRFMVLGYDTSLANPINYLFRNASLGTVTGPISVNGLDCMYFPVNKIDFHVYHDQTLRLAGSAVGNAGNNTRMINKFIKFGGKRLEYKDTAAYPQWAYLTVFIAADANDDTSSGTNVELSILERVYYKDA